MFPWIVHATNRRRVKRPAVNADIRSKNATGSAFPPPPAPPRNAPPRWPRAPQRRKDNHPLKPAPLLAIVLFAAVPLFAEVDPLKNVAAELAGGIRKQGPVKVAVLPLAHHDDHYSDGVTLLSDRLTSWLAADKTLSVVERDRLDKALEELHLGQSGQLDSSSVKSLGQSLGADVIVTGTIVNLPKDKSEVNARALLSKNGRIVSAGRAVVERTWRDRRQLD